MVTRVGAAVLTVALIAPALSVWAQPQAGRPPGAGSVAGAYFLCDAGKNAFTVQYGDKLARADITTAAGRQFHLKKMPVASGWMWKDGAVEFWTDGQKVTLKGTPLPYAGCQRKT